MNNHQHQVRDRLRSKIFKNMFLSYVFIILVCFFAYSYVVIHESSVLKKERMNQYFQNQLSEISLLMDQQLADANYLIGGINSSIPINRLYLESRTKQSVDPYLVFQALDDMVAKKAGSYNLNIYDVALFIDGYNRVYTSDQIVFLQENYALQELIRPLGSITNLNHLVSTDNAQIIFQKEFFIYYDAYRYNQGIQRGMICILVDLNNLSQQIERFLSEGITWKVLQNNEPLLEIGDEVSSSTYREFIKKSDVNTYYSYELKVDEDFFRLTYRSTGLLIALFIGFLLCVTYIAFAWVFSCRYDRPFGELNAIVNSQADLKNLKASDIVSSVENVVVERDGYKQWVGQISPYAQQGMLQDLLTGNVSEDEEVIQSFEKLISLNSLYYMVGVFHLKSHRKDVHGKKNIKTAVNRVLEKAQAINTEQIHCIAYKMDTHHVGIFMSGNNGDHMEDKMYDLFLACQKEIDGLDIDLTLGLDEVIEDVHLLNEALLRAKKSLLRAVIGGRGTTYYYEDDFNCSNDYYFPMDTYKKIMKAIKENRKDEIREILQDIYEAGTNRQELSLIAIEYLLDEYNLLIVKISKSLSQGDTKEFEVLRADSMSTLEEITSYCQKLCELACMQIDLQAHINDAEAEAEDGILDYVDQHYLESDISLTAIADLFHMNQKDVNAVFKRRHQTTYLKYVHEKRIAKAVMMMETSTDSLEVIAEKCGYCNLLTFRRNFKSVMGVNPGDYKQRS